MAGQGVTELRRARLIERLISARVGIVEAPGGYGKTTLSRQLAAARETATVEISLVDHTDRAGLMRALASGCRRAGHGAFAEALARPGSDVPDGSGGSPLDEFVAAVHAAGEPFTVVIDEMQFLGPDTAPMMIALADDLPAGSALVVLGRRTPEPLRTLIRRAGTVVVVADDLRLTADDVARLLRDVADDGDPSTSPADPDRIREVLEVTGGWPAAVAVALATATPSAAFAAVGRNVMARLVEALLATASAQTAAAVGALAHLPRFDVEVADAVAGPGSLTQLRDVGLPVLDRPDGWVELPDPVRDELVTRWPISVEARRAAAAIYARRGLLDLAVSLLQTARDTAGVAELLGGQHWTALRELGAVRLRMVIPTLDATAGTVPLLLVEAARAVELSEFDLRRQWLEHAVDQATQQGDATALAAARAEQARDLVRRGDRDASAELAAAVLAHASAESASGSTALANARARALWVLAVRSTYIATPTELAAATDLLEEAVALFRSTGEWRWEADALLRLGYNVSFQWGRLERAADQLSTALALLSSPDRDRALALTYFADVLDAVGRGDEGAAAAQEAAALGRRIGDPFVIGAASWSAMWIAAHQGDLAAVRRWVAEVERNPGRWLEEGSGAEFLLAASDSLGMLGDADGCRDYLARATARVEALGIDDVLAPAQARYEASFGDPVEAERILAALEGAPFAVERARWVRYAMRALAAHRRRDDEAAKQFLEIADTEARSLGLRDAIATSEPWIAHQLAMVLPPKDVQAAGSAGVRIRLLGGFAVTDGVKDITPAPGRPSLLVKLIATRGTMTNDEVIDILWPETDLAAGRARLRNLLNRLRTQARDVVVRQGESLVLATGVDVDSTRFEALAAAALAARPAERVGLARHALSLYPGELLPGDRYEDWVIAIRERLRRRYLALSDLVTDDAVERGDLDDAIRLLDAAIAAEPMDESRYLKAASALIRQGRRGTARDLVERAVRLADELGLRRSAELIVLRDELASGGRT